MLAEEENLNNEDDCIYINLGSWSTKNGGWVDKEIQESLNKDWPYRDVRFTKLVGEDGNLYHPTHSAPVWHIKKWISFLKECGGFEIY